ncbi:hypothetical protein HPB47_022005, partial [Ixodes persulcatus]
MLVSRSGHTVHKVEPVESGEKFEDSSNRFDPVEPRKFDLKIRFDKNLFPFKYAAFQSVGMASEAADDSERGASSGPLWQPGSMGYSPLSPYLNPALVKQLGDVEDHYHIRWQALNLQHLQCLWHLMKHCQRMVDELCRMERICIQLRFRRHVSRGHSQLYQKSYEPQRCTSWHSSRVQKNPASEEHTLTSPWPCTSNAYDCEIHESSRS